MTIANSAPSPACGLAMGEGMSPNSPHCFSFPVSSSIGGCGAKIIYGYLNMVNIKTKNNYD